MVGRLERPPSIQQELQKIEQDISSELYLASFSEPKYNSQTGLVGGLLKWMMPEVKGASSERAQKKNGLKSGCQNWGVPKVVDP